MASFSQHIDQAQHNLEFLKEINANQSTFIDWQITTCFYVGVHLINARLADKASAHYQSHDRVEKAINPHGKSPCKVDLQTYISYQELRNLSRISRYLSRGHAGDITKAYASEPKHLTRAFIHLDKLMVYTKKHHGFVHDVVPITLTTPFRHQFTFFAPQRGGK